MEYRIWFERSPSADLLPLAPPEVKVLSPGRENDPYAGLAEAQAVLAGSHRYGEEQFDQAPELLVICRTGIGYDTVDVEAAARRGIAVCNAPEGPTVSTAEHTVALILAASKRIVQSGNRLRNECGDYYQKHQAMELDGKTLGLVGFGRIARRVARAGAGLGMQTVAYDPFLDDRQFPAQVRRAADLDEALTTGDVISAHIPGSPGNLRLFDARAFGLMKPGAVFINTARGSLVDQEALLDALDGGRLFGAGLDVTDPEPLPPGHPLLHRPNVIVTPHIASSTTEGRRRIFEIALRQVLLALDGERPPNLVNGESWGKIRSRWEKMRRKGRG